MWHVLFSLVTIDGQYSPQEIIADLLTFFRDTCSHHASRGFE